MASPVEVLLILIGACFAAGVFGGSFVFGVAMVCRWLEWAPVNTTIHVNNYGKPLDYINPVDAPPRPDRK